MNSPVLERISRELLLRKRLQEALLVFARGVSTRLSLETGLEALATDINGVFGARRTAVWLHERRGRSLTLAGSSDPRDAASGERISTSDDTPIARGMREDGVLVDGTGPGRLVIAPLRGWRRALGTLVIEGEARELGDELLVELAMDLARQLSTAVESIVVLDELIRQHRLLADTFDSLADMVVVTDAEHRAVQVNTTLAERAGTARAELIDRPIHEVVGQTIASWTGTQDTPSREAATREFTGEPLGDTLAATATPLITQAGRPGGRVIVLRDITEQVRLRARLAQSEKLASLGQFVAGIAHEMNNPLQGVLGHLELMIDLGNHPPAHKTELRRVYKDADRAAKVVRNLLVFSGSSRAARRRVSVRKLVARVIATCESSFQRPDVHIDVEGAEGLGIVGDAGLLQQALLNVVINAEQAIAAKGGSGRILITTAAANGHVTITVEDSGPGIPPEALPQIFDPFFTTKEVGDGTGLGLAIAYGVLQEHGGRIHAGRSSLGGAMFTLQLPAAE